MFYTTIPNVFQIIPINNLLTVCVSVWVVHFWLTHLSANGGKGSKKGGTKEESLAKKERDLRREF